MSTLAGNIEPIDYKRASILAPCLLDLSEKYFKSKRAMRGSLVVFNSVNHPKPFLQMKILKFFNEHKRHVMGVMSKDARFKHRNASRVTDRAQNYMLFLVEQKDLTLALIQWKSLPTWNPLAQTVIVFMNPLETVDEKDKKVQNIFDELLDNGILFANVIYQMSGNAFKMEVETWFPYYDRGCARTVDNIYKIDECIVYEDIDGKTRKIRRNTTEFNLDKYPKIPNTLHNCSFTASAFIFEPFVVGSKTVKSGLEIIMLQTITKQMELDLNFILLPEELRIRKISEDNLTGIYANLIQK